MQRKKTRRDKTDYHANVASSLRIQQKLLPSDTSTFYLVAATLAHYGKQSAVSLYQTAHNRWYGEPEAEEEQEPPYNLSEDVKVISARFADIQAMINKIEVEKVNSKLERQFGVLKEKVIDLKGRKESKRLHEKIDDFAQRVRSCLTEQDSTILNRKLKSLEDDIKELKESKKVLDAKEKAHKAAKEKVPQAITIQQLAILQNIDLKLVQKLELIPELIREHARKRVDLFFLLMIAVYKQNLVIARGPTIKQHGKGSGATDTAGCHASLLPNPVAKKLENNSLLKQFGSIWSHSLFSGQSTASIEVDPEHFLTGTHFEDELNLTTELPKIVNDFDGHLEGKFRGSSATEASIDILNRVSKAQINPIQGLNEFGRIMSLFFHHMEYKYVIPKPRYANHAQVLFPQALAKAWEYEKEGTYLAFDESNNMQAKKSYVSLMLGLPNLSVTGKLASYIFSTPVENRMLALQNEIYSNESTAQQKNKK